MPITRMSDDEPTLVVLMNILFDLGTTSVAIRNGKTFLAEHHLEFFRTAEANALMATMLLHTNDIVGFTNFKSAALACEDATENLRLNLLRNLANWQNRRMMFAEATLNMQDPGFYSQNRPQTEKHADRLIKYVGRLLQKDMKAVGMLETLYAEAYRFGAVNKTYLRNIRYWLVLALCAVGRDKDAAPHALRLLGVEVDPLIGADPKFERRRIVLAMGKLRNTQLRMLAAKYAISKYRLK